ncbi:hypothetical protein ACFLXG_03065 [Chloroflexota bacterium]
MSITSKDYLSNARFKIEGVFGIKAHPSGAVLRNEKTFTYYLNSEAGVLSWLKEQLPFKELTIYDLTTRRDETKKFSDKFNGVS